MRRIASVSIAITLAALAACGTDGASGPPANQDPDASVDTDGSVDGGTADATPAGCTTDADCVPKLGTTIPAGCAVAKCDTTSGTCSFTAKDADGDGHGTMLCKATDPTVSIKLGDDCDDNDPNTYPNAWDGPMGDGHPNRCDMIDENCDGLIDNLKLMDGTSCACRPGDIAHCSQDSGGHTIMWPVGTPVGACKYGATTCLANGTFGPCTGAITPGTEYCNNIDDDCNGVVDDGPPPDKVPVDAQYWAYDGDDDSHARIPGSGYDKVHACAAPATAPAACTTGSLTACTLGTTPAACCPPTKWKLANAIPADDCNDENPAVNPVHAEVCINQIDDNCNGQVDESCVCTTVPSAQVDHACATDPNGNPITFPGGTPQGACHYGTRTCAPDGRSWGACNGAQGAKVADDCASVPPTDANCNGTIECPCRIGDTQQCANQKGSCAGSTQQCVSTSTGSTWGPCTYIPTQYDQCGPTDDQNCDGTPHNGGVPNTQCQCVNTTTESCGNCGGGSQSCSAGQWGGCVGGPGNIGQSCNVNGSANGACAGGGRWTCNPSNANSPLCSPVDSHIGTAYSSTSPAPNGSYDWNCDGHVAVWVQYDLYGGASQGDIDATNSGNPTWNLVVWPNNAPDCGGYIASYQDTLCGYINDQTTCNKTIYFHTCSSVQNGYCQATGTGSGSSSQCCGQIGWSSWPCYWNGPSNTGSCLGYHTNYAYTAPTSCE
jgi:hypothetical protein